MGKGHCSRLYILEETVGYYNKQNVYNLQIIYKTDFVTYPRRS